MKKREIVSSRVKGEIYKAPGRKPQYGLYTLVIAEKIGVDFKGILSM